MRKEFKVVNVLLEGNETEKFVELFACYPDCHIPSANLQRHENSTRFSAMWLVNNEMPEKQWQLRC